MPRAKKRQTHCCDAIKAGYMGQWAVQARLGPFPTERPPCLVHVDKCGDRSRSASRKRRKPRSYMRSIYERTQSFPRVDKDELLHWAGQRGLEDSNAGFESTASAMNQKLSSSVCCVRVLSLLILCQSTLICLPYLTGSTMCVFCDGNSLLFSGSRRLL